MLKINIVENNEVKKVLKKAYTKEKKNHMKKILIFVLILIFSWLVRNYIINFLEFITVSSIILFISIIMLLTSVFTFLGKLF